MLLLKRVLLLCWWRKLLWWWLLLWVKFKFIAQVKCLTDFLPLLASDHWICAEFHAEVIFNSPKCICFVFDVNILSFKKKRWQSYWCSIMEKSQIIWKILTIFYHWNWIMRSSIFLPFQIWCQRRWSFTKIIFLPTFDKRHITYIKSRLAIVPAWIKVK